MENFLNENGTFKSNITEENLFDAGLTLVHTNYEYGDDKVRIFEDSAGNMIGLNMAEPWGNDECQTYINEHQSR